MEEKIIYDTIIVGGGAAGLTAAIYTSRRAMKTLLVSQDIGGQAATTEEIENYPGVGLITGPDLMSQFKKQAEQFGTKIVAAEVISTKEGGQDEKGVPYYEVITNTETFTAWSVILAYGLTHRHLNVPGESEFGGKGVSYCVTCDGPLFKNRNIAIVGGGNSAVDGALLLAKICPKVYLIHRSSDFKAEAILVEQLQQPNIELVLNSEVQEIKGDTRVHQVVVNDINDKTKTKIIETDGIFIEVGYVVNSKLIDGFVELDARKQIKISPDAETSRAGIFAAGDITTISYKQIVISAGWGATAGLKCYEYLQKARGFRGVNIDWGIAKPAGK
ncbi:MAG: FAD-dependent oxidoreductase [Patescibacteria group bacterium]